MEASHTRGIKYADCLDLDLLSRVGMSRRVLESGLSCLHES
jgi:hypothetical protein